MSSLFFPSHQIQIYRRQRIGSTDRYAMSATFTAMPADIQPATKERMEMFNGRFGAIFTGYLDVDVDIKEGDQVFDSVGKKYSVKGVQKWYGAGILDYIEVVLVAQDAN